MSLYDILEIIGEINVDVKYEIVRELSYDGVKTNKIKNRLGVDGAPMEVLEEELNIQNKLTEAEYENLEDRLT